MLNEPALTEDLPKEDKIVTTEEEIEAFMIIKAILRKVVDPKRVALRDSQSYCAILLDDNNRRPICRLNFNTKQRSVSVALADKSFEKIEIDDLNDIYAFAEKLEATIKFY